MVAAIISFTKKGYELSKRVKSASCGLFDEVYIYTKCSGLNNVKEYTDKPVENWAGEQMQDKACVIFIGACGIAVRAIASSVENKLADSPVIVIDELGRFVIPVLSGHVGGANEIADAIAEKLRAVPVITTATDINKRFAADVFAKKTKLAILNKDGIAGVSSKVLAGQKIIMSIDTTGMSHDHFGLVQDYLYSGDTMTDIDIVSYPPQCAVDVIISSDDSMTDYEALLYLKPKQYVIGIGCKKGTDFEKIDEAITQSLESIGISVSDIALIASIDVKKEEPGIIRWSRQKRVEFVTYDAVQLMSVKGQFSSSAFVKEHVGVGNVCERAAVLACNGAGKLVYGKHVYPGITVAVSKEEQENI